MNSNVGKTAALRIRVNGVDANTQTDLDEYDLFTSVLRAKPQIFRRLLQDPEIRQALGELSK